MIRLNIKYTFLEFHLEVDRICASFVLSGLTTTNILTRKKIKAEWQKICLHVCRIVKNDKKLSSDRFQNKQISGSANCYTE